MNSEDIRIGNLFYKKNLYAPEQAIDTSTIYEVVPRTFKAGLTVVKLGVNIAFFGNHIQVSPNGLAPIPLTRELLLRFGLKEAIKSPANTRFTLKVSHKKAKGLSQSFRFEGGVLSASIGVFYVEFEYVHQFQNWVYEMTGQELELKN